LADEYLGSWQNHAFCDAVLVAEGGRRAAPALRDLDPSDAMAALRRAWPIAELHPQRRHGQLPAKMAQQARVCEIQFSRHPRDFLVQLDALRHSRPGSLGGDSLHLTPPADRDPSVARWPALAPVSAAA
jgi:hypothetical protein